MTPLRCPCGSGEGYVRCCRDIIRGDVPAASAEALMRSRYTAYVRRDEAYLLRTWHPSTRPAALDLGDTVWLGLEVFASDAGGADDDRGTVAFAATYEDPDGPVRTMRETSRFVREDGRWLYVDGDVPAYDTSPSAPSVS